MLVGRGLGTYKQETWWLNFLSCWTFYRTTWKNIFRRRRRKFHLFGCCSIHISSGQPAIRSHSIFPRCSSGGSTLEARIMQAKEKHKCRPQTLIRFHLQGCSSVLKPPPTLPTSNTHIVTINVREICRHLSDL